MINPILDDDIARKNLEAECRPKVEAILDSYEGAIRPISMRTTYVEG
jgi:hypothetical protein